MIRLNCPACGHGLQAKEALAGKQGRCPKCRQPVPIPQASTPARPPGPTANDDTVSLPEGEWQLKEHTPDGPRLEEKSPPWEIPDLPAPTAQVPKGLRKHPPLLDIFLYPSSTSGLLNLAVFFGLSLLGGFLGTRLRGPYIGILMLVGLLGLVAYAIYYLSECVRDSADGGTRSPDNLRTTPGLMDALLQVLDVLVTIAVLALPAGLYALMGWKIDSVFWTLIGGTAFFFPMALLSVILFDSMSGLNPRYWLLSVIFTFFPYLGLLVILAAIAGVTTWIVALMEGTAIGLLFSALVALYGAMISAHILGRFYFRFEKRIGWGI